MGKKNKQLFKERINLRDYDVLLRELSEAFDKGNEFLFEKLFGSTKLELYADRGKYAFGQHQLCDGIKFSENRNFTEKRLCKCMYYFNSPYKKRCKRCSFTKRFKINNESEYKITDYEVPAYYYGSGIGEIDLIISKDGINYATEVKPYKGNRETILRMIAEIMTYTAGSDKYKKAIAFFEINRENGNKSAQQYEYENASPELLALIKKADITVFRFEECGENEYKICKL